MKARMLLACLVLALGSAVWLGCRVDQTADPVGVDTTFDKPVRSSGGEVHANFGLEAHAKVKAETDGCSNNPGPHISINGELSLGTVNAKLVFSNNERGTHTAEKDVEVTVAILPKGDPIKFAKQPSAGGVGGNPWIFLAWTDGDGNYYGKPTLLGRCVQGLFKTERFMRLPSRAHTRVMTGGCDNSGGPEINLNGELTIGGLNAELIFTNNRKFRHVHEEDVVVQITILEDGQTITIDKAPPEGGAGGNPHIYLQFETDSGAPLSDLFYLGRCVQLGR